MSGTKRKRNTPLKLSEEKQTKMTWDMRNFQYNKPNPLWEPLAIDMYAQPASNNCSLTVSKNKIASPSKRPRKQEVQESIELKLDNSYPSTLYCKLGMFSVFLSTGGKHAQSPRHNPREECINTEEKRRLFDAGRSAFSKEILDSFDSREVGSYSISTELQTSFDVIVALNLATQQLCSSDHQTKECNNLNSMGESDCLKELKFKAFIPCITMEKLDALVYLQSRRVLSLVLPPEETILTECWKVAICLNECALAKVSFPSEVTTMKKVDKMIKIIMSWFFDRFKESSLSQNCEVSMPDKGFGDVYDAIKEIQRTYLLNMEKSGSAKLLQHLNNDSLTEKGIDSSDNMFPREITSRTANCLKDLNNIQHPYLTPTLRSYQKKAVWWMLCKELCGDTVLQDKGQDMSKLSSERAELHPLWKEIYTLDRKVIYYNPYTGRLRRERFSPPSLPLGGILADEMGLGKTVEVIACILNHPKPTSNDNYVPQDNKGTSEGGSKLLKEKACIQECTTSETNRCQYGRTLSCGCQLCISKNKENKTDTAIALDQRNIHCGSFIKNSHLPDVLNGYHDDESQTRVSIDHFNHGMRDEMTESASAVKCQCICGSNDVSGSDSLLHCFSCQAVFHASCLSHVSSVEFLCPHCVVKQPASPSRATLIISPAPIAQQWAEEISRHTKTSALKLLVYEGVAKMGFIQPAVLADNDIILTTYSTLRADFYHLGPNQADGTRSLRYEKRYVALPSPLTAVFFWRICLDEAQMVESATAKAAEVALHLNCKYRWCVTGTPLQRGLEDIYGLLLFLGVYPCCQRSWWKALLYEPYKQGNKQPLYNLLAKIMWRSAKNDVIDELQLPEQEETVKWLTFSPVEHHFYSRQHEECARTTLKMLSNWERSDTKLNTIDRHTVHQMLTPLLRLRQACCHPQAVRGGFLSIQKSTLTMDQLLESLIVKAKLECEEAHRQLLFAFNGLAGIHIIKNEWPAAVELYRDAMRSWTEHQDTFRTDALQKLHTLCNLSDVLSQAHPGCSRTLRDDNLRNEVNELKQAYMTRVNTQVTTAQQNLDVIKANIAEMVKMVDFKAPWWMSALQSISSDSMESDLLQRVHDELSSTELELGSFQHRFSDVRGLQYVISSKLDTIMSTHDNLLMSLERLNIQPTPQMVQFSAECCLRPAKDHSHATRCKFCEVDDIFTEYESRLFGHQGMKGVTEESMQPDEPFDWHRHGNTGGLRAESEVEKVLKVVFNFLKSQKILPGVHQEGRCHLNIIEALRKEFKFLRALWFALRERISSLDELDMCTTRLRLLLPGEPVTDDIHVIHPLQVEQQRLKFVSDRLIAQTELRKKLGQLLYLANLAKTQTCHDGKNPEPCPVCTKQLGIQWSVFSCGHCVCCQCAWELLRQAGIGPRQRNVHVKCPMCRIPTLSREISYVSTARDQTESGEEHAVVKGSHSTKVEAVVRTLLTIRMTDNTAKCLVFSTWQDVLGVVGRALEENGINYRHITGGSKHFQTNLKAFKQNPDVCVLLLPLHSGSNGLNIIEATHVLLVEPALNPAHELQAVGRVHRIGQTKPTHVYRFIIRGTVESRMFSLLQTKPTTSVRPGSHDNENSSLTVGDLAALFTADWEDEEQASDPFDQATKVDHPQSQ